MIVGPRLAVLGILTLAAVPGALAQGPSPRRVGGGEALLFALPVEQAPSQHPAPPLSPMQLEKLHRAQGLRETNLYDGAREVLLSLLAETPHHPLPLTELARVYIAKQDFAAVERLARIERQEQRDSLLLAREYSLALERLRRPREAAQVALDAWIALPSQAEWASGMVVRLAGADPRGVREAMQRCAERSPLRHDLLKGVAQLQWQLGDPKGALRALAAADRGKTGASLRAGFADELLDHGSPRDSGGAVEVLLDVAADGAEENPLRLSAAHRAWEIYRVRQEEPVGAPHLAQALRDLPPTQWPADLLAGVVRGLRQAGLTGEARSLLKSRGAETVLPPELALEQALADLKDGPPERALQALENAAQGSPESAFLYAEALFFAGKPDSALGRYKMVAENPHGPYTGASLERIYLIEDARPREALGVFGRIAYESWRGDTKRAGALAESLYQALPRGPLWAQAALELGARRQAAGDARSALEPLLAVADSLPEDRLAPRARQRAGDIYLHDLKDEAKAAEQYEECLARYPRAWNAPEIRRKLETLRREKRF